MEKKSKYKDLELEIQRKEVAYKNRSDPYGCCCAWYSKEGDGGKKKIKKVSEAATVTEIQKISMLGSARILRNVLSV